MEDVAMYRIKGGAYHGKALLEVPVTYLVAKASSEPDSELGIEIVKFFRADHVERVPKVDAGAYSGATRFVCGTRSYEWPGKRKSRPSRSGKNKRRHQKKKQRRLERSRERYARQQHKQMSGRDSETYAARDIVLARMGFINYADYRESDLWKDIRRRVYKFRGRNCVLCGDKSKAIHHHSYAEPVLRGEDIHPMYPMCDKCHKKIEYDGKRKRDMADVQEYFMLLLKNPREATVNP
jgi:hypothetical protein